MPGLAKKHVLAECAEPISTIRQEPGRLAKLTSWLAQHRVARSQFILQMHPGDHPAPGDVLTQLPVLTEQVVHLILTPRSVVLSPAAPVALPCSDRCVCGQILVLSQGYDVLLQFQRQHATPLIQAITPGHWLPWRVWSDEGAWQNNPWPSIWIRLELLGAYE